MPRACPYPTAAKAETRIRAKEEHLKSNQQEQKCDGAVHEGCGAEYLTDIRLIKPQIELCGTSLAQASLDGGSVSRTSHRDEPSCSIHDLLLEDPIDLS